MTMNDEVLQRLSATIRARRLAQADTSYTKQLLDAGIEKCAKKLGEEAVETVIAGVSQTDGELAAEAADLLFHLLVLLESRKVPFEKVLEILDERVGTSGLEEKASRSDK